MLKTLKFVYVGVTIIVINLIARTNSVTVNPLCPTNKIAPHKRVPRYDSNSGRTFGTFYDLLAPGNIHNTPSSLQEEPQADEPDDCGEIEDYDENDLSSISPQSNRRLRQKQNRFFFGWLQQFHPGSNPATVNEPSMAPYRPTRPPTGGYFGNNFYRPQKPQQPTDHIKPVNEHGLNEPHVMYQPGLVGGPLGHIVGLQQLTPTHHSESTMHNKKHKLNYNHAHTSSTASSPHTQKPKRPRSYHGDGIIGSFLDLLI